jgi:ankyrin repeat protein
MEHKWALFYHRGEIICVRSWLRQVQAIARVEEHQDHVAVTAIRGTFGAEDEDPAFTVRVLDYLLMSHALGLEYPAPLPAGKEGGPRTAALWCMSMFGNQASFATPHPIARRDPGKPLRTHSSLHIAVALRDVPTIEAKLAAGIPIDLLAADGLAPLHWARDLAIMSLLLERGSPVDVRSSEGATPLMNAVQSASLKQVAFLLDHGADVNARDGRGFTALHRAAEMGHVDVARMLLDRGASPNPEAQGHTPRSLAEARKQKAILALLKGAGGKP